MDTSFVNHVRHKTVGELIGAFLFREAGRGVVNGGRRIIEPLGLGGRDLGHLAMTDRLDLHHRGTVVAHVGLGNGMGIEGVGQELRSSNLDQIKQADFVELLNGVLLTRERLTRNLNAHVVREWDRANGSVEPVDRRLAGFLLVVRVDETSLARGPGWKQNGVGAEWMAQAHEQRGDVLEVQDEDMHLVPLRCGGELQADVGALNKIEEVLVGGVVQPQGLTVAPDIRLPDNREGLGLGRDDAADLLG